MAGAGRHQDLRVWQWSAALRDEVFALTEHGKASRDLKFRDQIRDSSSSAARNIAEGFALYRPRLIARHIRVALGSLGETMNYLEGGGGKKKYFTPEDTSRLIRLTDRTMKATKRLLRYLDSCGGKPPTDRSQPADEDAIVRERRGK